MVTMITFGSDETSRMRLRFSLALLIGICTCMMTTSGFFCRARATAPSSLVDSAPPRCLHYGGQVPRDALTEDGVVVCQEHPYRTVHETNLSQRLGECLDIAHLAMYN